MLAAFYYRTILFLRTISVMWHFGATVELGKNMLFLFIRNNHIIQSLQNEQFVFIRLISLYSKSGKKTINNIRQIVHKINY